MKSEEHWERMHKRLLRSAAERRAKGKPVRDVDAYVYGTKRKMGWRPSRERR